MTHSARLLRRLFPFVEWWRPQQRRHWRADLLAGLTVALVLVPQSMAYAQLAGLPPAYGLYTAFLPVLVGALWGSCAQLATGPVAIVSLLTAASLGALAAPGSAQYIAYAITLALLVGLIQLAFGAFRLGALVNLLSHPVIGGFTSAAAIIIALSQLPRLLGVPGESSRFFLADAYGVLQRAGEAHLPTLAFGVGAIAALLALRRFAPRWPGVLIVCAVATVLSAALDYSSRKTVAVDALVDREVRRSVQAIQEERGEATRLRAARAERMRARDQLGTATAQEREARIEAEYRIGLLGVRIDALEREGAARLRLLGRVDLAAIAGADETERFIVPGLAATPERTWRITALDADRVTLVAGGAVVGEIPSGLPAFALPAMDAGTIGTLLASALVIALVGFMEAVSIAKAVTSRTRERLDANQELIGQGLANLVGSCTQCYPASGSFSRTAVNFSAGARTRLSSVVSALVVLFTLLFLTPLLYHLPLAVLAAVIVMAVFALINFGAIAHAWRAHRHDGAAGAATFAATLLLAPNLDVGILAGILLSVVLFLYRTMRPRVSFLARDAGGVLRDGETQAPAQNVAALRFDGPLYFGNVSYFEDTVLALPARSAGLRAVLVIGDAITQIDASGDEAVRNLATRLREGGTTLAFSGLAPRVADVMRATGTLDIVGRENLFEDAEQALDALAGRVGAGG